MNDNNRIRILTIYTGGTIGMIENPVTHSLEPFDFDHLLQNVPKIKMLDFDIEHYEFPHPIDSSDMKPSDWTEIAQVIGDNYDGYDGFVVLHGTDTMAYTASALSFMLENLDKPVIITGSQLPIGEVRTDGEENLITALQIAAARDVDGGPMVREVAILFNNVLCRGNRSTKYSSDHFNAFKSNNYPNLARIGLGITFNHENLWRNREHRQLLVHTKMDRDVMYLDLFPGITEQTVCHLFATPGIKGIVMKTFGAGNGPTGQWFTRALRDAINRGIVVVNITQCSNGSVMPRRYLAGRELAECGIVPGHDMTSEAAITKLMYLFGRGYTPQQVKTIMEEPIRGELCY